MSKTKIVAICGLIGAVAALVKDIFDGGGFSLSGHFEEFAVAFGSLGLFFLRDAVQKIIDVVNKK